MSHLSSHSDTTPSERVVLTDFKPNPDAMKYQCEITASQFGSSDTLVEQAKQLELVKTFSVTVSFGESHACKHKDQPYGVGIKINSAESGVLQIQVYDRSFDIKPDALGASWTGRWMLFRHGYWIRLFWACLIRLLRACLGHQDVTGFHVEGEGQGSYIIRGSCCSHATNVSGVELEECCVGRLALAERDQGRRGLVRELFRWHFMSPGMSRKARSPYPKVGGILGSISLETSRM